MASNFPSLAIKEFFLVSAIVWIVIQKEINIQIIQSILSGRPSPVVLFLGFCQLWSICIVIVFFCSRKKKKFKKTNEETHKNGIKWSDYWRSFFSQPSKSIQNRWSFFLRFCFDSNDAIRLIWNVSSLQLNEWTMSVFSETIMNMSNIGIENYNSD